MNASSPRSTSWVSQSAQAMLASIKGWRRLRSSCAPSGISLSAASIPVRMASISIASVHRRARCSAVSGKSGTSSEESERSLLRMTTSSWLISISMRRTAGLARAPSAAALSGEPGQALWASSEYNSASSSSNRSRACRIGGPSKNWGCSLNACSPRSTSRVSQSAQAMLASIKGWRRLRSSCAPSGISLSTASIPVRMASISIASVHRSARCSGLSGKSGASSEESESALLRMATSAWPTSRISRRSRARRKSAASFSVAALVDYRPDR